MSRNCSTGAERAWFAATCRDVPVALQCAAFCGAAGTTELHVIAEPTVYAGFAEQLDWLGRAAREAAERAKSPQAELVFGRLFCSDLMNQSGGQGPEGHFASSIGGGDARISWIGQAPPAPAKVALWAHLVADSAGELTWQAPAGRGGLRRGALTHYWARGRHVSGVPGTTASQTAAVLNAYAAELRGSGMTLAENAIRTWFFVRDIDADYGELVVARRSVFAEEGLTAQTHYIASTGIEGLGPGPEIRVMLDAYAIAGVRPEQILYLRAPEHLCATDAYGVTFERGTAVSYRDRRHVFISGTASIDRDGHLLHPGDIAGQLERTLDNIGALLAIVQGGPDDLCYLIAYVRDLADEGVVRTGVRRRWGDVPLLVVRGAICRPGWLVEIEGQAIVAHDAPELPPF